MSRGGRPPKKLRFHGRVSGILSELSPTLVEVFEFICPLISTRFNTGSKLLPIMLAGQRMESYRVAGNLQVEEEVDIPGNMRRLNFSMDVFIAFLDAGLLLMERYFEVDVLINYHNNGEVWWFWLTLSFICMPGAIFIGLNLFSAIRYRTNLLNLFIQSIKYGLLFPLTTLFR